MRDPKTANRFGVAVGYAAVFGAAFWLLFFHLDNHPLWGDEAETAVLAKNVLQFGVPQTFDGTNYILLHGTVDETPNHVWIWSPWLQEYVAAGSFLFFGATTWAARAPFAFIGWCSLVLLALTAFKIYRRHFIALTAVILLGTSEIFLLHARQCRYYPISVFGEILFILGIYEMLAQNWRGLWFTALALVAQFYSNYIVAVANIPALFILAWMLRRRGGKAILPVAMVLGILGVAALPWLIYAHPWQQGGALGGEPYSRKMWGYLLEFHFHFMPLCFLLLPVFGFVQNRVGNSNEPEISKQWERWLLLLLPSFLIVILFAPGFYLRYLLPMLPIACLLTAIWICRHIKWRWLAVSLILIQVASDIFSIVTAYPFKGNHHLRFPLVEFVRGMSTPYADRFTDAADFFNLHARPGERILSFDPELPLIFYTRLGVINGQLMAPAGGQLPDWILLQSASAVASPKPVALPDFLKPHYEMITIMVRDSEPGDGIPEPDIYQYQSSSNRTPFVIYRRKPDLQ